MIKYLDDTPNQNMDLVLDNSQLKVQLICEKSLEAVLLNRKENLKLDPISYLLLLIIYNLSCFLNEINSNILLKIGEFLTYFYDIQITHENIVENLLIIKLYLEIVLSFLINLEFPSQLILVLLKFDEQLKRVNEKYESFHNSNCGNDEKQVQTWNKYFQLYNKLGEHLKKIKNKIEDEGANIKFTQNNELLKIINKISIDKNTEDFQNKQFKENKIFGTDTEKFIILNINSFENQLSKILKD